MKSNKINNIFATLDKHEHGIYGLNTVARFLNLIFSRLDLFSLQYNLHMYQISTRVGVGHFFKLDMTVICSGDVSIRMHCPFCPHTARSFVEIRYLQSP